MGIEVTSPPAPAATVLKNIVEPYSPMLGVSETYSTIGNAYGNDVVMAGLGPYTTFTPKKTGRVLVILDITFWGSDAYKAEIGVTGNYGTGTPPSGGQDETGTEFRNESISIFDQGTLTVIGVITGLKLGVPAWVDVGVIAGGASQDIDVILNKVIEIEF